MATQIKPEKLSKKAIQVGAASRSAPSKLIRCLRVLASLKFTAVLLAMSVFIVLVGTLAQVERGIWDVVDNYFRIDFHKSSLFVADFPFLDLKSFFAKVEFRYFFPPQFFPINPNDPQAFPHNISGGFYFPKGWLIGLMLSINLLAAHGLKFKVQARGVRCSLGLGVIAVGILTTALVILSGFDKDGVQDTSWIDWNAMWLMFKYSTAALTLTGLGGCAALWILHPERKVEFWVGSAISTLLLAISLYLFIGGDDVRLNNSSMRILWQLLKATFAGSVLLAGCWLLFKKRAGIVLIHSGVGLMMVSELLVGINANEANLTIPEGQTVNYVEDSRSIELAVVDVTDPSTDREVVIPKRMIVKEGNLIADDSLPFDMKIVKFYQNSNLRPLNFATDKKNLATKGFGLIYTVDKVKPVPAIDSTRNNLSTVYLKLTGKPGSTDTENQSLGVYMFPLELALQKSPEFIEYRDKKYEISLRFKRTYKPYQITLYDFTAEYYEGTNTPKRFSSEFRIVDPEKGHDGEHYISMNNPLRYGGETFYQNEFRINPETGIESTIIQVVVNTGWVIPYVACMLVAVGMLAHFLITLTRFFTRRQNERNLLPPLKEDGTSSWNWIVPLVAIGFAGFVFVFTPMKTGAKKIDEFDIDAFGAIPVFDQGRSKPMDSLARERLRILSGNKEFFKNRKNEKQPAIRFLLDLIAKPKVADTHRIFRVDHPEIKRILDLELRKTHLYSLNEINKQNGELLNKVLKMSQQAHQRGDITQFTSTERKAKQLIENINQYFQLKRAVDLPEIVPEVIDLQLLHHLPQINQFLQRQPAQLIPLESSKRNWENLFHAELQRRISQFARSQKADTTEELVHRFTSDLKEKMVKRAITLVLSIDFAKIPTQGKTPTIDDFRNYMIQRFGNTAYIAILQHGMSPTPSRDPLVIASRMDDALKQTVYDAEVRRFVSDATRSFSKSTLKDLRESISKTDRNSSDRTRHLYSAVLKQMFDIVMNGESFKEEDHQSTRLFLKIVEAYRSDNPEDFSKAIETYRNHLSKNHSAKLSSSHLGMELFLNRKIPFLANMIAYFIAAIAAGIGLFVANRTMQKFAFWTIATAFVYHSVALYLRMEISGRPPVTNLYSSAIFCGWGCVLLGLILESVYRMGFGNVVAALAGGSTLLIAHNLPVTPADADSLKVMQAVLDTTFWLATHVICVTLGYSTTALAGVLGIVFIASGIFTPLLNEKIEKTMGQIIYGTLCFAIFFSFIGTVLGGLWADDSWGRFWGWDPKENGALMIVLWNAMILHLRWDKSIKARGLAILTSAGLLVLSWSWFGGNQLGVGLHAYGAQEAAISALKIFGVTMTVFVLISCVPKSIWWSYVARDRVKAKSSLSHKGKSSRS